IRFMWKELNALMKDTDLFRPKHDKPNWKTRATCNIGSMKDILRHQQNESQTHFHLFEMLCDADVDTLLCNDPLVNSIVDLGALVRQVRANFITKRNEIKQRYRFMILPSEKVTHARWVEQEYERERVTKNITDDLLLKIKSNIFRRVSDGSENSLVEAIAHLIEASLCQLPLEYNVDVVRGEKQSIASKNQKVLEESGSRGDKPDLMIRASLKRKQYEVAYVESGKWDSNDKKICDDHNKLAKLCSYGYKEIVKERLKKVYIAFGVNIAGNKFILHGLVQEKGIKYYLPIAKAKIPFCDESLEEVEEFVHTLLILR
ncbi:12526_t:CDS:2, partial [Dentiscutata heterogama]